MPRGATIADAALFGEGEDTEDPRCSVSWPRYHVRLQLTPSYSTRVSPQFANRMVEAARSILNRYVPDIYLYTDVYKGEESGK